MAGGSSADDAAARSHHLSRLLAEHHDAPWRIRTVTLHGLKRTRRTVVEAALRPALAAATLGDVVLQLKVAGDRLAQLDVFSDVAFDVDVAAAGDALDVALRVRERPAVRAETGTHVGASEASVHASMHARNVCGVADHMHFAASFGSHTYSAFEASVAVPRAADPRQRLEVRVAQQHTSHQASAAHDLLVRSFSVRAAGTMAGAAHSLAYVAEAREVLNVPDLASLAIRHAAGRSLKSALVHSLVRDTRDAPSLATRGTLLRLDSEYAGIGGDARHVKSAAEAQINVPLPRGLTWSTTLRAGALIPLQGDIPRIVDKFFLGGPTSVRAFKHHGLGPRDGVDALGGTLTYSLGTSLFVPLKGEWLRGHLWCNAGHLANLHRWSPAAVHGALRVPPSVSAGLGLALRHPACRLELNWGVPLVAHRGDAIAPVFTVGLGVQFL